jgi:HK97 family phage major capsid protein/HK97 family phage prohead protease
MEKCPKCGADLIDSKCDACDEKKNLCGEVEFSRDQYLSEQRPYPGEHSCRLENPDKYERFARKNCYKKHDGKCIDYIFGIPKGGGSELQAMRYKKETWTADSARSHCKSAGGSFEAASEKQIDDATIRTIKVGMQYRGFTIEQRQIDEKKRTIDLSFSSEEPVERFWGIEILDHQKKSVNLRRLKRGGALLIDHDMKNQVGVIEEVSIDEADRKGRAKVRFGRSAKAEEIFQDVIDEIRSNVSVGYQIEEAVLEKEKKNEASIYRVTQWEPYEISLVSVPADINVGVGRGNDKEGEKEVLIRIPVTEKRNEETKPVTVIEIVPKKEERKMEKCAKCSTVLVDGKCPACEAAAKAREAQPSAVEMEKRRKEAIGKICIVNKIPDNIRDAWVGQGLSLDEVADQLMLVIEERGKVNPQPMSRIGMTEKETQRFSFTRAILACMDKDWRNAPFELECSKEVAKKLNRVLDASRFFVPFEILERPVDIGLLRQLRPESRAVQRDFSVAFGGGAYLVDTTNVGFIEMLRNRSVCFRMGARRLSGLVGNVTIPKQSGAATAYWLTSETSGPTESNPTILQVTMTPKTVGAYTEISRQLAMQSTPGAEAIVTDDLAQVVAVAADLAGLSGSGLAGQPLGVTATPLIGTVNGAAIAYVGALEFQSDVASSNITPIRGGYVTYPAGAVILMTEMKVTNAFSPLWEGNLWDGMMCGFPAMSTNQLSAGLIFGDWQELVIGEWGVLEVEVNPYANFAAGIMGVRALYSLDTAIRRAVAFSYASAIT